VSQDSGSAGEGWRSSAPIAKIAKRLLDWLVEPAAKN
jgi:hypothetical protein